MDFDKEIKRIRRKYVDTGYPKYVTENTIKNFNTKNDELIIPPLFDERKQITIHLLFSSKNEKYSAYFFNKLVSFTSGKVMINVVWNTRKIQTLFLLYDNVQHLSCVIYKGICSCGETYVSETTRNCRIKWDGHNDVNMNTEPAKHLAGNIEHEFSWYVLTRALKNALKRIILEAYFIKLIVPSLKE